MFGPISLEAVRQIGGAALVLGTLCVATPAAEAVDPWASAVLANPTLPADEIAQAMAAGDISSIYNLSTDYQAGSCVCSPGAP